MFYPSPKKIQLEASQAKWTLSSIKSVLIVIGLDDLQQNKIFKTQN